MDDWEFTEDDINPRPEVIEAADGYWDVYVWCGWDEDMVLDSTHRAWDDAMMRARELEETQEPDMEPMWEYEGGGVLWG